MKFASNMLGITAFTSLNISLYVCFAKTIQANMQQQLSQGLINQAQADNQLLQFKNDFRNSLLCRK
ncbi:MAG: hypothetical protein EBQ95_02380 [Gammaproteobacteria bacterium]|nr:hypothetical protein [Gammaproteobacteria bacterium]